MIHKFNFLPLWLVFPLPAPLQFYLTQLAELHILQALHSLTVWDGHTSRNQVVWER